MSRLTAITFALMSLVAATTAVAQPHPFTVHDLIGLDRLSEPAVSPDGSRVVFTVSALDAAAGRRRTDLWAINVDGRGLRQLTTHQANDTSAIWAADGKAIYFLSSRSGSSQVWRMPADGGEAEPVTTLPLDVGAFALSPRATNNGAVHRVLECGLGQFGHQRIRCGHWGHDLASGRLVHHGRGQFGYDL